METAKIAAELDEDLIVEPRCAAGGESIPGQLDDAEQEVSAIGVDAPSTPPMSPRISDTSDDADTSAHRWRRWLPSPVTAVLAVLLTVSVTIAAVLGWKLKDRHDIDTAGRDAMAAAQEYAVTLTSIDAAHVDSDMAAVTNGATGDFKTMYTQSADQLKPLLVQAQSSSKGHVVAASIQSASTNQVVVMLFVDAAITNVTNPTPRVDRNRIVMTMDKVAGHWLAGKVDLP